jgi:hypothetical protein
MKVMFNHMLISTPNTVLLALQPSANMHADSLSYSWGPHSHVQRLLTYLAAQMKVFLILIGLCPIHCKRTNVNRSWNPGESNIAPHS